MKRIINGEIMETEVSFTRQEADIFVGMLDLATKTGGLQVAANAVVLARKIGEAFKSQDQQGPEEKKTKEEKKPAAKKKS